MILIFTPCHGRRDLASKTFASIEVHVPRPWTHLVVDDFSPPMDSRWFGRQTGPVADGAKRAMVHAKNLGLKLTEPPNLGATLGFAWEQALKLDAEALLCVESDVLLRPGIVEAFREAQTLHRGLAGAVAPLYVKVRGYEITSFGGFPGSRMSLPIGAKIGGWKQSVPLIDSLPWAHLACLWVPRATLERDIHPDPEFRLYFQDHDLCNQIRRAGLEIIVTDRAVAEHDKAGPSTGLLWGSEGSKVEAEAHNQLLRKWKP